VLSPHCAVPATAGAQTAEIERTRRAAEEATRRVSDAEAELDDATGQLAAAREQQQASIRELRSALADVQAELERLEELEAKRRAAGGRAGRSRGNAVGGMSFHLSGDDGHYSYGTHLSAYGASGRVSAGTVIGYVGDTGNARGMPHPHFEIHPNHAGAVDPYPATRAARG